MFEKRQIDFTQLLAENRRGRGIGRVAVPTHPNGDGHSRRAGGVNNAQEQRAQRLLFRVAGKGLSLGRLASRSQHDAAQVGHVGVTEL